jgi:catechol 2,3-dioxygenase-like lactoylglutathione lyase family enzyme
VPQVHHAGLCPADLEASLRFYVDGLGLDVLFDVQLETDLEPLLGERTDRVRTVFLGSSDHPDAGTLELLDLGTGRVQHQAAGSGLPRRGLFLLSFQVPVEPALARLAALGLGSPYRRMTAPSGSLAATVVDPDGVLVELLDQPLTLGRRTKEGP